MKKILSVLLLLILVWTAWLVLRQPKTTINPIVSKPKSIPTTNIQTPRQVSAVSRPVADTNVFVRPTSFDEETWNKWMAYRQTILAQNQPVEFYARVVDQNGQPIEEAKLKLKISRIDERLFATTNFLEWDPTKAIRDVYFNLDSDANGWIQLTQVTGMDLRVEALAKEGYSWTMPQIGSFGYGPERAVGYAGMEDAFNPEKGYVFHMEKVDENSSTNSTK